MNIMIIALCPSHQLVMPRSWNISILHTPWDFSTDTPQGEIAGMLDKPEWRCLNVRCGSLSRAIFLKTAHVFSFKAIPFSPLEWQLLNVGYSVCVCVCLLGFPAFILSWFRYCLHLPMITAKWHLRLIQPTQVPSQWDLNPNAALKDPTMYSLDTEP